MCRCCSVVARANGRSGFTLLEMMIVLVLMSLITGLVVPRLDKVYSGLVSSFSKTDVLRSIAGIGYNAMVHGRSFTLAGALPRSEIDETTGKVVEAHDEIFNPGGLLLPEGWRLVVDQPIVYRRNGLCLGGRIELYFEKEDHRSYLLLPPYCIPERYEEDDQTVQ